jgi:hypothetical protein
MIFKPPLQWAARSHLPPTVGQRAGYRRLPSEGCAKRIIGIPGAVSSALNPITVDLEKIGDQYRAKAIAAGGLHFLHRQIIEESGRVHLNASE